MNVGLPGTGIGGLFYLLSALLMPVVELFRTVRGRSSLARWRMLGRQFGIAVGMIGGLWATGWLLNLLVPLAVTAGAELLATAGAQHTSDATNQVQYVIGAPAMLVAFLTLGALLVGVETLRLSVAAVHGDLNPTPGSDRRS